MSKLITVQDGNLVLTAAGTDVIGDNANVASFQDEFITTDNDNITFLDTGNGGFYDTITSDDTGVFFGTAGFRPGMVITVSGSTFNDGTYTIGEAGVTDTVITILGGFTNEGPISTATVTLLGIDKAEELTTGSFLNIHSTDGLEEFSLSVSNEGWMEIREQAAAGSGLYVYGNGHLGVFDYTEGTADPTLVPVDATDTAYATVGGWNDGQWQLWEVGTFSVADMDLTIHNYVPDAAITMWVDDITDTNYRRVFEGDYATGANLFWPATNAIALSTDVAGIYSPLGSVYLAEKTTPGGDTATRGQLWVRNDNPQTLMFTDGDSTDFTVAGALSGAVSATGTPLNNEIAVFVDGIFMGGVLYIDDRVTAAADVVDAGQLWVREDSPNTMMYTDDDGQHFTVQNIHEIEYYYLNDITSTDPGAGRIKFDSLTPASITTMYISDSDNTGRENSYLVANLAINDVLSIRCSQDEADYIVARVTSVTDSTGFWTIGLAIIHSGTIPSVNNQVRILVEWQSEAIAQADAASIGGSITDNQAMLTLHGMELI